MLPQPCNQLMPLRSGTMLRVVTVLLLLVLVWIVMPVEIFRMLKYLTIRIPIIINKS